MFPSRLVLLFLVFSGTWAAAETKPSVQYDVVVYGGVPCGIAASIAAAREGASVVLIEPTKHVGGLNTSGLNTAESEHMLKWTFGGIALEFYQRMGQIYGTNQPEYFFESHVAEQAFLDLLKAANVPVRYGVYVVSADREGKRVRRITLSDGTVISGKTFIDASYEGDLMALADVSYTFGRESTADYGEDGAGIRFEPTTRKAATVDERGQLLPGISGWAKDYQPGAAHPGVMNYNWRLTFTQVKDKLVPIPAPQHYDQARYRLLENWLKEKASRNEPVVLKDILDLYPRRNGHIEVNNKQVAVISIGDFGAQFKYPDAGPAERQQIIAEHTDYTLGLLHFLANDPSVPEKLRAEMRSYGLHKDEFTDNGNWPYQLYVREARRMRAATVVTQKDVIEDRRKPDSIAVGSHFIDSHHVQRLAASPTEFVNEGRLWRVGYAYQIPYRALTPKPEECENLLVPGAASYTHVAYCTLRLESTWMMVGHAAGVAASMSAQSDKSVQSVDLPSLQNKLRTQGQIIDFLPAQPEQFEHGKHEKQF
ncbi:FAD-dependent oxidoreductase [Planctomicrobium piriforme]|uniref:FAD dependent oxidoreductase n=1 Tax=Planctomicrobium piriforme TaxID=1576369 RepID=A0A1I3HPH2_9PLAN|nr:FAD-dependent oxidoreductase [Planctomicrobium piriforme]SFI37635.1 FAD dependent oxidoreductase [Planctomicrobium piriforme]